MAKRGGFPGGMAGVPGEIKNLRKKGARWGRQIWGKQKEKGGKEI